MVPSISEIKSGFSLASSGQSRPSRQTETRTVPGSVSGCNRRSLRLERRLFMNITYNKEIAAAIEQFLKEDGWHYSFDGKRGGYLSAERSEQAPAD